MSAAYQIFTLPKANPVTPGTVVLPGSKAFFYVTGTTTLQNTYSDSALTTPNANPVIADASGLFGTIYLDPSLIYKLTLKTSADVLIYTVDPVNDQILSAAVIGAYLYPRTAAEIAAGVTPVNYSYAPGDVRRYGAAMDGVTDDTAALNRAILVALQGTSGAAGNSVFIPGGTLLLSSEVTLPNHVRIYGVNKESSYIKASATWNSGASPFMLLADNGASSMFDSLLENLTVDANDIAGLGCIQSNAWQENCGPRGVLLYRFRTYGILFSQTGYATSGGAAFSTISDTEMFGSTSGATACVKVEQISSAGTFVLCMARCTLSGATGVPIARCIDIVNDSTKLDLVHFENATTGLYVDGVGSHSIDNETGDSTVTNVYEIAAATRSTWTMRSCRRGSATNLIKDNRVGGLGTVSEEIQFISVGAGSAQSISNITKAASAVVTIAVGGASNPYVVSNQLTFSVVVGMTQINGLRGTVTAIGGVTGAWTVTVNINSSGFSAYTSGGALTLPANRGVSGVNVPVAWCVFDGSVAGTNGPATGCNVKSITRNAAGDYTVNFTNPLLDASAGLSVMTNLDTADSWWAANLGFGLGSANFSIRRGGAFAGGKVDASNITAVVYGLGT